MRWHAVPGTLIAKTNSNHLCLDPTIDMRAMCIFYYLRLLSHIRATWRLPKEQGTHIIWPCTYIRPVATKNVPHRINSGPQNINGIFIVVPHQTTFVCFPSLSKSKRRNVLAGVSVVVWQENGGLEFTIKLNSGRILRNSTLSPLSLMGAESRLNGRRGCDKRSPGVC